MKMKLLCAVGALCVAGLGQTALADDATPAAAPAPAPTPDFTITGNAEIASQYRFRGISQSNNRPVLQGAITITHKSGFYLATWGSTTYGDPNGYADQGANGSPVNPGGTEIDVFGGWSGALGKSGVTLDGGLYSYIYPGNSTTSYFEIYGDLSKSFGPVGAKIGVNFAPSQQAFDYVASHESAYKYFELTFTPTSVPALTFHTHVAHTAGGFDYVKQYVDFTAGVGYKWKSLTFDISAVGTNVSKSEAYAYADAVGNFDGTAPDSYRTYWYRPAKTVAVVSVTASF